MYCLAAAFCNMWPNMETYAKSRCVIKVTRCRKGAFLVAPDSTRNTDREFLSDILHKIISGP